MLIPNVIVLTCLRNFHNLFFVFINRAAPRARLMPA